ncbi:MAG: hypothetical protein LUD12_08415 [Lachnospiraceae bacterium]|nr:hypothetical protein [Lachnospiraceae bacterium]
MLCNSEYIAFFNQSEIEMEILRNTLRISDNLLEYVQNTPPGCGLLKFGGGTFIPGDMRIKSDSAMYKLANTNFHEIQNAKCGKQKELKNAAQNLPENVRESIRDAPTEKETVYLGA